MAVYSMRRHRRELGEIGRMYLLVVGLFLAGLLVWKLERLQGPTWQAPAASSPPAQNYGR
ncbi:MAG: hypothetical protein FJY95_14835 [Candidatus Handelsmanbacteria bacterium]|nr:hypothetical protein [Candidatus Handelsmanbacteria bacterium]